MGVRSSCARTARVRLCVACIGHARWIAAAPQLNAQEWLTPPQVASERGIRTGKVLAWIASGQLVAVNHATRLGGRPRWRISRLALLRWMLACTDVVGDKNQNVRPVKPERRTGKRIDGIVATIMAIGRATISVTPQNSYDQPDFDPRKQWLT